MGDDRGEPGPVLKALLAATEREPIPGPYGTYIAYCPAHGDWWPPLTVQEFSKGTIIKCHAGCTTEEVLAVLNLSPSDLFDKN